jgi:hypothetical protein
MNLEGCGQDVVVDGRELAQHDTSESQCVVDVDVAREEISNNNLNFSVMPFLFTQHNTTISAHHTAHHSTHHSTSLSTSHSTSHSTSLVQPT